MNKNDKMISFLSDIAEYLQIPEIDKQIEIHNKLVEVMQYLTYPTEEEVCEAIKKDFPTIDKVIYQNGCFYNKDENDIIILKYFGDTCEESDNYIGYYETEEEREELIKQDLNMYYYNDNEEEE